MKKLVKIFVIIILCFVMLIPTMSYATDTGLGDLDSYGGGSGGSSEELQEKAEAILGVIQIVGTVVSVAMLMIIGIKYMMGSIEERAEYKENLKPYLIGAFLIFSGTMVPQIIYLLAKNL